jgi:translocation and assembly module TamB
MPSNEANHKHRHSLLRRIGKVLLWVIGILISLVIVVIILIQTPWGQNIARTQIQGFLAKKLETKVEIGKLRIRFPTTVELGQVYLEDKKKDTLLYAGFLKADLDMWSLLHSDFKVDGISLKNITASINRSLPDTQFNFQFIIDAFASPDKTTPADTAQSKMRIDVGVLNLENIRLRYEDVLSGNMFRMALQQGSIKKTTIEPGTGMYSVPEISITGLNARLYQETPLKIDSVLKEEIVDSNATPLQLRLGDINLAAINWEYKNADSKLFNTVDLRKLLVKVDEINLDQQRIALNTFQLDTTNILVQMGSNPKAAQKVETDTASTEGGWTVTAGTINMNDNSIRYDDDNQPAKKSGMDYAHIDAKKISLKLTDFIFHPDSIRGKLVNATLTEKSGLVLNELKADFIYADQLAYLKNFTIATPGTVLQTDVSITYPSMEALQKDPGLMQLDLNLNQSKIQAKDILLFVPDLKSQNAFKNPLTTLLVDARLNGSLKKMNIPLFRVSGWGNTKIDISGTASSVTDVDKMYLDLAIKEARTSRRDLDMILPPGTLPQSITLPSSMRLGGRFRGGVNRIFAKLDLRTDLGNLYVNGNFNDLTDKNKAGYNFTAGADNFDVGTVIQNDSMIGFLTADFSVKGKGYDPQTMRADVKGNIPGVDLKGYNYKALDIEGSIADKQYKTLLTANDPNLRFELDASGTFEQQYPSLLMNLRADSIEFQQLNLSPARLFYRGNISADFSTVNPDSLVGSMDITDTHIRTDSLQIFMDTLNLTAGFNDTAQFMNLQSDFVTSRLEGTYKLTEMGNIFTHAVKPYFDIAKDSTDTTKFAPYDFTWNTKVYDHPVLRSVAPDLTRLDSVVLLTAFKNEEPPAITLRAPAIVYGTASINGLLLTSKESGDSLAVNLSLDNLTAGAIKLFGTDLDAAMANNQIVATVSTRDRQDKERYRFGAKLAAPKNGHFDFSLYPEKLLLNYQTWYMNQGNRIQYAASGINIDRFILSRADEEMSINSYSDTLNAPIELSFLGFKLSTLSSFVSQDTSAVDGNLTGKVLLMNLLNQPVFVGDLKIADVSFNKDTLGDIALKVQNPRNGTYEADIRLTGHDNDVRITGEYAVAPGKEGVLDLVTDIKKINLASLEGVSQNMIRSATGYVDGNISIKGTIADPDIIGRVNFNQTRFNFGLLNSFFSIDDEAIEFIHDGVKFNTFQVADSAGNKAVLNGTASTKDYRDYRFDLTLKANNFKALNTTRADNKLYYGQLYFNTDLRVKGTSSAPVIDGTLAINENTNLTVVLPSSEPGVEERKGIIEFVDMDSVVVDTVITELPDSLNHSDIAGISLSANISINKEAELTLVVDEGNGDFLRMKGEGQLSGGMDPGGAINLSGSYEIEEGTYELTFNFLKRKFSIQKGSKIIWKGEPTAADVDITAIYEARTSPLDLMENQLSGVDANVRNTYKQKLPFEVKLMMKGELMQPDITFDVALPEEKNYTATKEVVTNVNAQLEVIRREPSEMNKQVFALLLLNRFVSEDPFSSSTSTSAESMARSSVSKIFTEQLNSLAADLIKGVDVDFDVESTDDYTTGTRQNRTDLNVALSKKLLNDRLTVTVGSNFELEGAQNNSQRSTNVAGNISLNYMLSEDGRYMIRGYRKNAYEGVLEGYIVETGIGFIITVDYNKFRQVFMSKKQKEKRREQRRAEREAKKEAEQGQ